ncbi:MAG: transcriptional regulator NrdR [Candidatus Faecivivens sp.]|nr:transcriptional regulator NrdR [Candidatus Faecivivens sp.]
MKCPYCGFNESKVIDSRPTEDDEKIRRRRECLSCGKRFTTYEIVETTPLMVIKKDHSRQIFDREKLMLGIIRACDKRPVTSEMIIGVVDRIEQNYVNRMLREVSSEELGEAVLLELKKLDKVAYIRFASVYRDFSDVTTFINELQKLQKEENPEDMDLNP